MLGKLQYVRYVGLISVEFCEATNLHSSMYQFIRRRDMGMNNIFMSSQSSK